MKTIDSQALGILNKALGLSGSGSPITELLDGTVDQVLDVTPIARRGRTLAGTDGIFRCILRNIHAGAGDISTAWQPYTSAAAGVVAPFPSPMPDSFDIWLIGASIERVSGAGLLTEGLIRVTNIQQGFGIDSVGVGVPASLSILTLARWTSLNIQVAPAFALDAIGYTYRNLGLRLPHTGAVASPFVRFDTESDGIATFDLVLIVGVFPISLGQDVAV